MAGAAPASFWRGTRFWDLERLILSRDLHRLHRISWCRFISPSGDLRTLRGSSSDDQGDHQAMNAMRDEDIRAVVAETLAEQQRLHHDEIDAVVLKTIATILISFGIEEEDRKELRADFQHLRRWRKSVEQAQSYTFKAVITVIVTGFVGAVWLGIKVMLGK
jgi:hypothetical protein